MFGQVWLSPCRLCQALLSAPSSSGWFLACRPSAFFSSLTLSGFARSGLGVLVLVRSVSPCKLVLEVRLFPLRCFVRWPVVGVRFFLPLAFQGWPGSGQVCV